MKPTNGKSTPGRKRSELTMSKLRSTISNGTNLLADLDHRGAWARRLRDLIAGHVADLGGADAVSQSEQVLIRRSAMLTLQLELMEQAFTLNDLGSANTQQIEAYQRCTNTLRRTLEALGLQRRPRTVGSDGVNALIDHVVRTNRKQSRLSASSTP
jgi:hypothetical protein